MTRRFDRGEGLRQRRPVRHFAFGGGHRRVVGRAAPPLALVDRLELNGQLVDDLDFTLAPRR